MPVLVPSSVRSMLILDVLAAINRQCKIAARCKFETLATGLCSAWAQVVQTSDARSCRWRHYFARV
jgi:hypothetical protein